MVRPNYGGPQAVFGRAYKGERPSVVLALFAVADNVGRGARARWRVECEVRDPILTRSEQYHAQPRTSSRLERQRGDVLVQE